MPGNQRGIFLFAAKPATRFRLNNAYLVFRQVKQLYERFVNVVRTLHRTPHRNAFFGVGNRDGAVVLDIELFLRAGFVFTLDDVIRVGPGFVNVAFIDEVLLKDVIFAPDDLFPGKGVFEIEDGWQFLDLDAYVPACFLQQVFIAVREQHDRLFGMVYKIRGEIGLVIQDEGNIIMAGNVFGSDDGELVPRNVAFEGDACNSASRRRATHRGAVKHIGEREIIDVQRLAGDFLAAFFTRE